MDFVSRIEHDLGILESLAIGLLVIATISVALRIHVRAIMIRSFGLDDWAMVLGWVTFVVTCSMTLSMVKVVRGVFTKGVIPTNLAKNFANIAGVYVLVMLFLKLSLGTFFLRIIPAPYVWQRTVVYTITITSVLYSIVYFFFTVLTCGATAKFFFSSGAKCALGSSYDGISTSWSIFNAATDLIFALIAALVIWTANFPRRTKITASAILALGSIGGIASVIRVHEILRPVQSTDDGFVAGYWSLIEAGIGIFAASLATLRPILHFFLEKAKGTFIHGSHESAGTTATLQPHFGRHKTTRQDCTDDSTKSDEKPPVGKASSDLAFITSVIVTPVAGQGEVPELQTHGMV